MWAHKHTTHDEAKQTAKAKYSEPPRQAQYDWFPVSLVVYSWTDKREIRVDKTYWETAGQDHSRSIVPVPVQAETTPADACLQELGLNRERVPVAVNA